MQTLRDDTFESLFPAAKMARRMLPEHGYMQKLSSGYGNGSGDALINNFPQQFDSFKSKFMFQQQENWQDQADEDEHMIDPFEYIDQEPLLSSRSVKSD